MNDKDITRPETWNEWTSADLDRWLVEVIHRSGSGGEIEQRLTNTVGHLLNRVLLAEAQRRDWQRASDRWRQRFLDTQEGKRLIDAVPPAEGMTAGDRVGTAIEERSARGR